MSQVKALKEQIDTLCQEKGVEAEYKSNSTISELEEMLVALQGSDSGDSSDSEDGTLTLSETESSSEGDVLIKALQTLQLLSHGQRVTLRKGDEKSV